MTSSTFVLLFLLLPSSSWAQLACTNAEVLDSNPLGTCICEGHVYINDDCSAGFVCQDLSGLGCYKECQEGSALVPNFKEDSWECVPNGYCLGGFDVCPSDGAAEVPATRPESNPLGSCRCTGEIWLSEGCTFSYECDDAVAAGGRYFDCTEGRVVFLDFETGRYSCIDDVDTCPGGQISGVGCPVPECQIGKNNLGTCECDSQFFINADCTEGFVCTSNIPDPYLYDGCLQTCNRGEILVPDFAEKTWQCLDNDPSVSRCNGAFNLECPQNDIGTEFNSTMCECDGQLLVDHDCRNGFYCFSLMGDGGWNITCPEGQIIVTDTRTWNWGCEEDNGQCPGLGGYKFGCREGNPDPPQLLECNFARNPFGECECVNEFFISEDCSTSFFCSEYRPSPDVDGCLLQCADGQTVKLDPTTFTWTCVPRNESFICPGEFKLDCTNTFDVHCNCENEVWMNGDCTQAAVCTAPEAEDGSNALRTVSCPDDQILDIDFYDFTPGQYQCTEDVTQCPGSFHFGCQGLDLPDDGSEDNGGPVLGSTLMLVTSLTLLSLDI